MIWRNSILTANTEKRTLFCVVVMSESTHNKQVL